MSRISWKKGNQMLTKERLEELEAKDELSGDECRDVFAHIADMDRALRSVRWQMKQSQEVIDAALNP